MPILGQACARKSSHDAAPTTHRKKRNPYAARNRFDPVPGRATMKAVVTTGNGGYDKSAAMSRSPCRAPARSCCRFSPLA